MKKNFNFILVSLMAILIGSCAKEETKNPITNLAIVQDIVMLNVGNNDTLKALYHPLDATNKTLIWSSTNASVVSVNNSGVIVAIAPGEATVKVTTVDKSLEATCDVIVTKCTKYLNNQRISSVLIDRQGNIWCGSLSGIIYKYDGNNWTNYTFWSDYHRAPAIVYDIDIDANDNLWIASSLGLSKYNGTNLVHYDELNSGLPLDFIKKVLVDGQNIWVGTTNNGVIKFDGTNWTAFNNTNSGLAFNTINTLVIDKYAKKWICTNSGGVSVFDNTNWVTYNTANSGLLNQWVTAICIDKNDNKWIGSSGGVSLFNGTSWVNYTNLSFVQDIIIDEFENKWFGTGGRGLFKFNGTKWIKYTVENSGLSSDVVYDIKIDSQGKKWLGTNNGVTVLQN